MLNAARLASIAEMLELFYQSFAGLQTSLCLPSKDSTETSPHSTPAHSTPALTLPTYLTSVPHVLHLPIVLIKHSAILSHHHDPLMHTTRHPTPPLFLWRSPNSHTSTPTTTSPSLLDYQEPATFSSSAVLFLSFDATSIHSCSLTL